jgi:hypothetical protein
MLNSRGTLSSLMKSSLGLRTLGKRVRRSAAGAASAGSGSRSFSATSSANFVVLQSISSWVVTLESANNEAMVEKAYQTSKRACLTERD